MTLEVRSINQINTEPYLEPRSTGESISDRNFKTELTETNNSFDLDNIDKSELLAITIKLREERILDPNETLDQWLSEMMPQIIDGENLTVSELLAGLRQFIELQ